MADKMNFDFDLIVIGSGPGGQRAAVQAAKLATTTNGLHHSRQRKHTASM